MGFVNEGPLGFHDEFDELFGMAYRQRFQNDGVDQAENGRIGANAESERQNRDGGKPGTGAQGAERVTDVLKYVVEHVVPPEGHLSNRDTRRAGEISGAECPWS